MESLAILLVVALGIFYLKSHDYAFWLEFREGRFLLMRGSLPPSLLADFADITRAEPSAKIRLRAHKGNGRARLLISGTLSEGTAQRLRNAFGLYPEVRLRAKHRTQHPNLGQRLGWPWLAFALARTRRSKGTSKDLAP